MDMKTSPVASDLADGFYIVQKAGLFFTFRVKAQDGSSWYDRKQVISVGRKIADATPMPSREWWQAGTIENGVLRRQGARVVIEGHADIIYEAMLALWEDTATSGAMYAQQFGRCCVCNRKLTHPESVSTGIGPECAGKRNRFTTEEALAEYIRLYDIQSDERSAAYDRMPEPKDYHILCTSPTSVDTQLEKLERLTHRHGYFYWYHWQEDEWGCDEMIHTIEKIEPTGTFDAVWAGERTTEIERILRAPHKEEENILSEEERRIGYLANKEGLTLVGVGDGRWQCRALPGREAL